MILDQDRVAAALPAYDIGGELGRGGWGAVLEGRHRQLGRDVAIKQLPRAFAAAPDVRSRFVAEARVLASLDHPHIVPVYDFVDADGLCLLVMEKLALGTVWSRFVRNGFTPVQACAVALATCAALDHAHRQGVLHRDVKPENVMFSGRGILKVTDFGIAKMLGGPEHLMTRAGEVLGTPAYMAPEQAQAGELTPATDVYAAGLLLYELLSGELPYPDDGDPLALLYRHVHDEPRPVQEIVPGLPDPLAGVVMRAVARDPADRYPSAEAFGVALAAASQAVWGPGWIDGSDVRLVAAGSIAAEVVGHGAAAPPTMLDARPMRPSVAVHVSGVLADGDAAADVVPLREALRRPPFPRKELAATLSLVALLGGLALVPAGRPGPRGDLAAGEVAVVQGDNIVDIATAAEVPLDLAEPVQLDAAPGVAVDGAHLGLTVAGIELAAADGAPVDLSGARHLAAGPVRAELELADGRRHEFTVEPRQPAWMTAPGALGLALVLLLAAYAESLLRSLRRGRKQLSGAVGLAVLGLTAGVLAVDLAWLAGRPVTLPRLVACAVTGAAAGLALARLGRGIGRRRRPAPARGT